MKRFYCDVCEKEMDERHNMNNAEKRLTVLFGHVRVNYDVISSYASNSYEHLCLQCFFDGLLEVVNNAKAPNDIGYIGNE